MIQLIQCVARERRVAVERLIMLTAQHCTCSYTMWTWLRYSVNISEAD